MRPMPNEGSITEGVNLRSERKAKKLSIRRGGKEKEEEEEEEKEKRQRMDKKGEERGGKHTENKNKNIRK